MEAHNIKTNFHSTIRETDRIFDINFLWRIISIHLELIIFLFNIISWYMYCLIGYNLKGYWELTEKMAIDQKLKEFW